MRAASALALVLASTLVAGCGGAGGGGAATPHGPGLASGQRATATLTVHWTATGASAAARKPKTISPSAASIVSSVNGSIVDITNRYGAAQTQITLDAPVGTDAFTFKIYDQTGGVGNLLGQSSVTKTIVAGDLNVIAASIEAVCAQTVVTPAYNPTGAIVLYTYAPPAPGQLAPPSIASAEIVGAGSGELSVAAADADGNVILAPGGHPVMTAGLGGPISAGSAPDATHVLFFGVRSARGAQSSVNVAAPGCPAATFTGSSSSAIYVTEGSAAFAFDRYGTYLAEGTPPGTLVGTDGPNPIFYDPATGNVYGTNPDLSSPYVQFTARAGASLFSYDAGRRALVSVVPGASSSTVNIDYASSASKAVVVPLNVTTVTAGTPSLIGISQAYFVGDGTKIVDINASALTASAPVVSGYTFGLLAESGGGGSLYALNTASPYATIFSDTLFPSGYGSNNQGFTAPVTRAFAEDVEDFGVLGVTATGSVQHVVGGTTPLPSGSSMTGILGVSQITVSYPNEVSY